MKSRILSGLVVCGLLAYLTACTPPRPEPTKSPTSGRTAAPQKPKLPKAAGSDDEEGAIAFARYYYQLVQYGNDTGDWGPVKGLSVGCSGCKEFWTSGDRLPEKGHKMEIVGQPSYRLVGQTVELTWRYPGHKWRDRLELYHNGRWWVVHEIDETKVG